MEQGWCSIEYMGVLVGMKRFPCFAFNPLLERIRSKLSSRKRRTLSFAGKIMLLQSVLQVVPIYLMCSGWVPKTMLDKVDGYYRRFLLSRDGEGRGLVLAAWDNLCRRKKEGGLGFRLMRPFHKVLLGK